MRDFDLEQQLIDARRRRYGEQAQAQAPQGRMVGGRFVAPHALEYLAAGLRGFGGIRGQQMAEDELKQLQTTRQQAVADALRGFNENMQGTPEQVIPNLTPMDDEGNPMPQAIKPAQPQNIPAAFRALSTSPDAAMRQFAQQGAMQFAQKAAEQRRAEQDRQRLMGILQNSTPQQAIAAGVPVETVKSYYESRNFGRDKVQFKDVDGQLVPVTEFGDIPANVTPLQKTGNPFKDMLIRGADGELVINQPLVGAKRSIAAAGRPTVNVDARNFNTQESEQSKVYGKGLGEIRATINQAGFDAPKKLAQLGRMEELLTGIDGGAAAPAIADMASFAQSFGVKLDPKLGNKQAAEALTRELAGALRQPGTGPMTDKDFDNFLKQVPGLSKTAEGRAQIITTMRAAIQRDIAVSKFAREYARRNNGVIDDNFFDALSEFYVKNPVVTPPMPARNARGQSFGSQPGGTSSQQIPEDVNRIMQLYTPGAR
jgi:hypothetical protein